MKPTLFISHATADAEVAKKLRDWLLFVTGNSIEVFASVSGPALSRLEVVLERINTALGTTFTARPHALLREIVDADNRSSVAALLPGIRRSDTRSA